MLRWDVARSPSLRADVRARFLARFARRITTEGELVMTSQRYRDRERNMADCVAKLRDMLAEVATPPKRRKPTRPTRGSRERRLASKRAQARKKTERRVPPELNAQRPASQPSAASRAPSAATSRHQSRRVSAFTPTASQVTPASR